MKIHQPVNIHNRAREYSRQNGVSIEAAYRELSLRAAESRRRRRGFAHYGKVQLTPKSAFWWNES